MEHLLTSAHDLCGQRQALVVGEQLVTGGIGRVHMSQRECLGERTHIGAVLLASSLVADLQLLAAAVLWGVAVHITDTGLTPTVMASVVSLSGGALLANIVSMVVVLIETSRFRR
ncbi:MAG: DUF6394 family protein [Xanthomonadales bacterium]|nr:DUF6394 family protein [Xanthomonadales bacterium]